jgi:hypothetical protein
MAKWFMAVWGEKRRKNTVEVAAEVVARESEVEMNKRLCFVSEKQKVDSS